MTIKASAFDYKLLKGSHEFPGPAGGACLNEVAIVAAGLDYRSIENPGSLPPCFSKPIGAAIIMLNDNMKEKERQLLKRFVLRMAGSADSYVVEGNRVEALIVAIAERMLRPIATHFNDMRAPANRATWPTRPIETSYGAVEAARGLPSIASVSATMLGGCTSLRNACHLLAGYSLISAAIGAAESAVTFARFLKKHQVRHDPWADIIDILDLALSIGNQAPAIPNPDALLRLGRVFRRETVDA